MTPTEKKGGGNVEKNIGKEQRKDKKKKKILKVMPAGFSESPGVQEDGTHQPPTLVSVPAGPQPQISILK